MTKRAIDLFVRAKPTLPPSAKALQDALAYLNAGRLTEAEGQAHSMLAANPNDGRALNVLGCVVLRRGQPNEALKVFERAKALQPRDPLTHFHLGEAYLASQSYADAARHYKKATKLNHDFAEAHAQLGDALRAMGRWADSESAYRTAIRKRASLPNCWQGLGLLSVRSGEFAEAAKHFEAGIKFVPPADGEGRASLWSNVGRARLQSGRSIEGIEALTEAVKCAPTNREYPRLLAESLLNIKAVPAGSDFRDTLFALFERKDINPSMLATAAIAVLKSNSTVAEVLAKVGGDPECVHELIEGDFDSLSGLVKDRLFLTLLSNTPIPDKDIELLLTGIRRQLLLRSTLMERAETRFDLSFVCALARQCYLTEYVYLTSDNEVAALGARPTENVDAHDWSRLCILASYRTLNETDVVGFNLASAPEAVRSIVREQIEEPKVEDAIGKSIEVLKSVADDVSCAVRTQYEENPFPRWTRSQTRTPRTFRDAVRIRLPHLSESDLPDVEAPEILIAGCGTGLQTMNAINSYNRASILAVDLSLRSLAYGMRKLSEYGIKSVRHLQADILDLGMLPQRFDLIESFGVLHHMRDPLQGLHVLSDLLKPAAFIFLGLYSELARQSVVAARNLVAERGHPPTVEGIRAARRDIMMAGLSELVNPASDFWTTSECRDLIFHAQEHRLTLLEIDAMLESAGLQFMGIELTRSSDQQRFATEFPGREAQLSLRIWHDYETRYPDTFGDTYRIWAKKRLRAAAPCEAERSP